MNTASKFRDVIKYRAGALCLVGILTATFMHSTTFMSQFFYNSIILGAIAAFAIDAGVVAMSIFKDELIKNGELAWMVRVVTCTVLFASGVANMAEGFKSAYGITLTYDHLMSLDLLVWFQWLAGTIIFPILAYVMCDTIGTRNLVALRDSLEKDETPTIPRLAAPLRASRSGSLAAANAQIRRSKEQRKQLLEEFLEDHPDASLSEMADAVGVSSRETVRRYLNEMSQAQTNGAP